MRMIHQRIAKLEQAARGGVRLIVCRVRAGHEDADEAEALSHAGLQPDASDLVVGIRMFALPAGADFRPQVMGNMELQ